MMTRQNFERLMLGLAVFLVLLTFVVACSDYQTYQIRVTRCLVQGGSEFKCTGRSTGVDN